MESRKKQKTCVQVAKKKDTSDQNEGKEGDATNTLNLTAAKHDGEESTNVSDASTMKVIPTFGKSAALPSESKEIPSAVKLRKEQIDHGDNTISESSGKSEPLPKLEDTTETSFVGDTLKQGNVCEENLVAKGDIESVTEDKVTNLMACELQTSQKKVDENLAEISGNNEGMIRDLPKKKNAGTENESRTDMFERTIKEKKNEIGEEVPLILGMETSEKSVVTNAAVDCQTKIPEIESAEQEINNKLGVIEDKKLKELPEMGQEIKEVTDGCKAKDMAKEKVEVSKKDETATAPNSSLKVGISMETGENGSANDVQCIKSLLLSEATIAQGEDNFVGCVEPMDFTSSQLLKIEAAECEVVCDNDIIVKPGSESSREPPQPALHRFNRPTSNTSQREERQEDTGRAKEVMKKMMKDLNEIKLVTGSLLTQMSQYRKHRSQRQPQPSAFMAGNQSTSGQSFQRKSRGSVTSQFKKY